MFLFRRQSRTFSQFDQTAGQTCETNLCSLSPLLINRDEDKVKMRGDWKNGMKRPERKMSGTTDLMATTVCAPIQVFRLEKYLLHQLDHHGDGKMRACQMSKA